MASPKPFKANRKVVFATLIFLLSILLQPSCKKADTLPDKDEIKAEYKSQDFMAGISVLGISVRTLFDIQDKVNQMGGGNWTTFEVCNNFVKPKTENMSLVDLFAVLTENQFVPSTVPSAASEPTQVPVMVPPIV